MSGMSDITQERAARRFGHIATLERQLAIPLSDIQLAKAHVKELQEVADGLMARMRKAARDEGELPLFDLDEQP